MNFVIKIISVEGPTEVNKYKQLVVNYYRDEKAEVKKLVSFSYPDVFRKMSNAKEGELFTVSLVKEKDYWHWSDVKRINEEQVNMKNMKNTGAGGSGKTVAVPVDPRETAWERENNRRKIIRQSCIGYAIQMLKTADKVLSAKEVLPVSEMLENWVHSPFEVETNINPISGLKDDIPFKD